MVQILKDSVKNQITRAAEHQFAKAGYKKATMGAIAAEAGVAAGTIYKYFKDKKALFREIVSREFVEEMARLTGKRIAAFAASDGLDPSRALLAGEAGELLRFWVENRWKVVILLDRAEGSEQESFARDYIGAMASQTLEQARKQYPTMVDTDIFRFMVNKILADSVRGIVTILESFDDTRRIYEAFAASSAYQLAGIRAFIEWSLHSGS